MKDKIKVALSSLDPENNDHWTSDNQPRLDVVKGLVGADITRADIQSVSKTFNRKNPSLIELQEPAAVPPMPSTKTDPVVAKDEVEPTTILADPEPKVNVTETAIVKELEAATMAMHTAQARFRKAQAAMDEVITARTLAQAKETFSGTVKQYQAAQNAQRAARVGANIALAQAVKTMNSSGKV